MNRNLKRSWNQKTVSRKDCIRQTFTLSDHFFSRGKEEKSRTDHCDVCTVFILEVQKIVWKRMMGGIMRVYVLEESIIARE